MWHMIEAFILWAVKRAPHEQPVVTFDGKFLFNRFEFLRRDEWPDSWWDEHRERHAKRLAEGVTRKDEHDFSKRPNALPWWMPFNAFVHSWNPEPGSQEGFHDHPRWSVTICLKGQIIERTPWSDRLLKPRSVVIRSRRAIHAFKVPEDHEGEIWTLFIVGRRKCRQNTYVVTAR